MSDIIIRPAANAEGDFANALEFRGLEVAESATAASGTYDVFVKVGAPLTVTGPSAPLTEI